jgi:hypothetical protein
MNGFKLPLRPVPIATRRPLPHVQFEIHDITERFRWNSGAMDFIHARNIDLAVRCSLITTFLLFIENE